VPSADLRDISVERGGVLVGVRNLRWAMESKKREMGGGRGKIAFDNENGTKDRGRESPSTMMQAGDAPPRLHHPLQPPWESEMQRRRAENEGPEQGRLGDRGSRQGVFGLCSELNYFILFHQLLVMYKSTSK
jgi:hypothetical protein